MKDEYFFHINICSWPILILTVKFYTRSDESLLDTRRKIFALIQIDLMHLDPYKVGRKRGVVRLAQAANTVTSANFNVQKRHEQNGEMEVLSDIEHLNTVLH